MCKGCVEFTLKVKQKLQAHRLQTVRWMDQVFLIRFEMNVYSHFINYWDLFLQGKWLFWITSQSSYETLQLYLTRLSAEVNWPPVANALTMPGGLLAELLRARWMDFSKTWWEDRQRTKRKPFHFGVVVIKEAGGAIACHAMLGCYL